MGFPPTATPPHLYPQELQLKLYQAFIFSIPILFSIILFLLFYLFYLKRRPSSLSSPTQILPTSSDQSTQPVLTVCQIGLKKEIKDKLPIVLFDEELMTRESQTFVIPTTKLDNLEQSGGTETPLQQDNSNSNHHLQIASEQQQQQEFSRSLVIPIVESSSAEACSMDSVGCPELSISSGNGRGCSSQESVAPHIQT
ncbi:probable E3 ubiquitin-protein ligase RHA4A isoform X2 [Hevea brasiliensis]|uniref:probable E3 ubiquitin-protein ligase RHA4A isoform X2 n=1 Tax=Hevea brasiliensis TaxID=3981 RepID=UPI0025FADA12|nr:probable E3 ubiquitin-protein ligase RHA4A isoform X2 [Hevea brasiliensis]